LEALWHKGFQSIAPNRGALCGIGIFPDEILCAAALIETPTPPLYSYAPCRTVLD
jgi:hypothetical protein